MAAARRRLGFEVTTELDADRVELIEALRAFTRLSAGADVVPRALRTLRTTVSPAPDDRVVPLSPQMVGAALRAGGPGRRRRGAGGTAHSGRVGLASELTRRARRPPT